MAGVWRGRGLVLLRGDGGGDDGGDGGGDDGGDDGGDGGGDEVGIVVVGVAVVGVGVVGITVVGIAVVGATVVGAMVVGIAAEGENGNTGNTDGDTEGIVDGTTDEGMITSDSRDPSTPETSAVSNGSSGRLVAVALSYTGIADVGKNAFAEPLPFSDKSGMVPFTFITVSLDDELTLLLLLSSNSPSSCLPFPIVGSTVNDTTGSKGS